ncbi:MAG: hypothetical protein P8Q97_00115 [Myxococcota bacterium]|nr:hypothetical protein [Myxococcota bacterium]
MESLASPGNPGLCQHCAHGRTLVNKRGQHFQLCERAKRDPRYSPYPPLPVLACPGHEEPGQPE